MNKIDEINSSSCCSNSKGVSIIIDDDEDDEINDEELTEDCIEIQPEKDMSVDKENDMMTVKFEKDCGKCEIDGVGGSNYKQNFASNKNIAEGMMDIALLTANANQLRFLITYNSTSQTYYISLILIIISLVLQVTVGIGLIFKRKIRKSGKRNKISRTNDLLVGGIFMITVVNVFIASFTTTDT